MQLLIVQESEGCTKLRLVIYLITLPRTNSSHLKIGLIKRKGSYSNHPFKGAMLVSGRVFLSHFDTSQLGGPSAWWLDLKAQIFAKQNVTVESPNPKIRHVIPKTGAFFWRGWKGISL